MGIVRFSCFNNTREIKVFRYFSKYFIKDFGKEIAILVIFKAKNFYCFYITESILNGIVTSQSTREWLFIQCGQLLWIYLRWKMRLLRVITFKSFPMECDSYNARSGPIFHIKLKL